MRLNFKKSKTKHAFTLAEVLITLGIIGVIAGMTIPNLIANYQKDQTINQLKSVYTILNNALEQAKVENGTDVNNWYIPSDSEASASAYFAQNYLLPYLKTIDICGSSTTSSCKHAIGQLKNLTSATKTYSYISGDSNSYSFALVNGTIVQIVIASITGNSLSNCRVIINFDINGKKKPNIYGKDTFVVELGGDYGSGNKNKFVPYCIVGSSRDSLLSAPDLTSCNKISGNGSRCFAVIMQDGWRIADDYPW